MTFREEIEQHYTDPEGMISGVRDPDVAWTSGNHLLITSTYYVLLNELDRLTPKDMTNFTRLVQGCEVVPGVYNRNAGRYDLQAHDDYIGIIAASYVLGLSFVEDILNHGEKNGWLFDNTQGRVPSGEPYFGRLPDFAPLVRSANRQALTLWEQLLFCGSLLVNALRPRGNESGVILSWLETKPTQGKHGLIDLAISFWKKRLVKKYPNGMGEVFGIYYGVSHPYSVYYQQKV